MSTLSPADYDLPTNMMQAQIELRTPIDSQSGVMFSSAPSSWEDEDGWIVLAKQGDQDAFVHLYDRYYMRIYRYVSCRVRRVQDVEDLTQQVFLQAWGAIGHYEQRSSPFKAWLFTIAYHLVVNEYRRKPTYELNDDSVDRRPDSDPENVAVAHWQQERLGHAIAQLLPTQQQVILLRFRNNLHPGQIAAALGRSEVNVRVIQHRALRQLRNILEDDPAEGFESMKSLDRGEDDSSQCSDRRSTKARRLYESTQDGSALGDGLAHSAE